jgi:hypothetical protein
VINGNAFAKTVTCTARSINITGGSLTVGAGTTQISTLKLTGGDLITSNNTTLFSTNVMGSGGTVKTAANNKLTFDSNNITTTTSMNNLGTLVIKSTNLILAGLVNGGGIANNGGTLTMMSAILTNNFGGFGSDLYGAANANHCLLSSNFGATLTGSANIVNVDPMLGPLAANGGPTMTHALPAGSAALNAGSNPAALVNDQRGSGFNRTGGAGTDIGAFEMLTGSPITATVAFPGSPAFPNQRSVVRAIVVSFSGTPFFPAGANAALNVSRLATSKSAGSIGTVPLNAVAVSGSSATITFSDTTFAPQGGAGATQGGSLIDRQYAVTIVGTAVNGSGGFLDGNNDGFGGDSKTTNFFRLFGDSNGDGQVTLVPDFNALRANFNPNFNTIFDYNNDGLVTTVPDFNQFRAHFFPFAP